MHVSRDEVTTLNTEKRVRVALILREKVEMMGSNWMKIVSSTGISGVQHLVPVTRALINNSI